MPDCVRPYVRLCDSLLILHCLLEFAQESVMLSIHLILCHPPFFCPQSFPASGLLPMSWLFASGGQSIGVSASASVLPVTIQGWFPLGLTGLVSLQSKGLSGVFSSTTVRKHQVFGAQPSLRSNSHIRTWPLERPYDNGWQPSKGYQHTSPALLPKELLYQLYIQVVQCFWRIEWLSICQAFPWNGFFLQSFIKSHFGVGWEANLMTLSCRGSPPWLHTGLSRAFKRYQCSHSHPQGSDVLAWGFQ